MTRINPNLLKLAELTHNPDLKTDSSILEQKQQETYAPELEGYIYVPSINLYVAKEKSLHNLDFYKTQEELHKNNNKMLTPYEFFEFIKHLKSQNTEEYKKILDEILTKRNPSRAEWLDHDYKKERNSLYVIYHKYNNQGKIKPVKELLDKNTLMEDKKPGIDLEYLLNNKTSQGLPKSNTKEGSLHYLHPRDNNDSVLGFVAYLDKAGLGHTIPSYSYPLILLGVHATKFS